MTKCPICESQNTQRMEMAFATHSNNYAGALTAPPRPRSRAGAAAGLLVGALLVLVGFLVLSGGGRVPGLMIGGAGGLILWAAGKSIAEANAFNDHKLPVLLADWKRLWVCLACGCVFEIDAQGGGRPVGDNAGTAGREDGTHRRGAGAV
jgi:hypothetical protein